MTIHQRVIKNGKSEGWESFRGKGLTVEAEVRGTVHPVFQDMQTGASGKRHVDICMIMAEDEMVDHMTALKFSCKLIKRFI